jgi:hypothetical protein
MSARARSAAGVLGAVAVLCLTAPSAEAKSGIEVSAVRAAGGAVAVSGFGGDDAGGPQRLCLQQSAAKGWHTLVCGRVELGTGGRVRILLPAAGPRPRFRALLQRTSRAPGVAPVPDLVSGTAAPAVARPLAQRQMNSRSVVSLSSTDKGIETASVVRSK